MGNAGAPHIQLVFQRFVRALSLNKSVLLKARAKVPFTPHSTGHLHMPLCSTGAKGMDTRLFTPQHYPDMPGAVGMP